ncbi:MAG: ribosome-binding factor A [Moraxellaceae bacterium]|nr:MAG: ribosome-binding factor A [Moraxellaceae bacterium]
MRHSPRGYSRTDRIADQMQRDLAVLVQRELKDPRLGMTTISGIKVSRDLAFADVYVTFMGIEEDEEGIKQGLSVLTNAAGFLRSSLAKGIKLRVMPSLRFHYDQTVVEGPRMSALINRARSEDIARSGESEPPADLDAGEVDE